MIIAFILLPSQTIIIGASADLGRLLSTIRKGSRQSDKPFHSQRRIAAPIPTIIIRKKDKNVSDYISWDEYFMGVAKLSALRSKDPNTQVGACIVSSDNKILSMGYNGLPRGCSDDEFPWCREGDPLDNKYFYTTHSELNAILNYRGGTLDGAKMYVTLFPCNECAKAIIQAGIKTVVYDSDKYKDTASVIASKRMLNAAGVRYYRYEHTNREITIEL